MNKASSNPSHQPPELEKILQQRAQRAAHIIANPHQYKVCEGCESIVTANSVTCPTCHSYRFDASPERVTAQAQLLATRLPQTLQSEDYA